MTPRTLKYLGYVAGFLSRHPGLVDWILVNLTRPYFHIPGYMNRWWLLKPPVKKSHPRYNSLFQRWRRAYLPIGIRFHELLRADVDRHLHDHPWWFASLILKGGYAEQGQYGVKGYTPGAVNYVGLADRHKIVYVNAPTLTLVIHGPKVADWGFWTDEGWVPHEKYLGFEGEEQ